MRPTVCTWVGGSHVPDIRSDELKINIIGAFGDFRIQGTSVQTGGKSECDQTEEGHQTGELFPGVHEMERI